jgi:hypothetical protein
MRRRETEPTLPLFDPDHPHQASLQHEPDDTNPILTGIQLFDEPEPEPHPSDGEPTVR